MITKDQMDRAQEHYDAQVPEIEEPSDEPSEDDYETPQYPDYDYDYYD